MTINNASIDGGSVPSDFADGWNVNVESSHTARIGDEPSPLDNILDPAAMQAENDAADPFLTAAGVADVLGLEKSALTETDVSVLQNEFEATHLSPESLADLVAAQDLVIDANDGSIHFSFKVAMGILLMVVQTVLSLYGTTLMRLSHVRAQEIERGLTKAKDLSAWRRPRCMWWCGLGSFLGSQALMPFALALAPMSLLAPLSSCQILINLVMAFFILGERVTKRDLMATVLCCGFAFGVLFFGPKKDTGDIAFVTDIVKDMKGWGMIFMIATLVVTIVSFVLYKLRKRIDWNRQKYFIMPWLHVSLATFSLIFTKGLGTQILHLKKGDKYNKAEAIYQLLITCACILACSPGSAYFQVRATEEFDARWFIPMKFAGNVVLQLFLGAAAFHEWEALPTGRVLLFLGFSFLCVLAVGLIDPKDSLTEKLEAAEALQKEDDCKPGDGRTVEMSFEDLSDMEGGSVKSHHIHAESTTDVSGSPSPSPALSKQSSCAKIADDFDSHSGCAE